MSVLILDGYLLKALLLNNLKIGSQTKYNVNMLLR